MGAYRRFRGRRPVIPERVRLGPDTLRKAIKAEKGNASFVRGAVASVLRLGDGGYHEVRFDPARVRGRRGAPGRIDEQFTGALFSTSDNSAKGIVLLVDEPASTITVRVEPDHVIRPAAAFTLWPLSWLGALSDWAARLEDLPARFVSLEKYLAGGTPVETSRPGSFRDAGLRPSQVRAVELAGQEALLLWGPPGTGKTFTMGAIAARFLSRGESVLGLSTTNVAVDRLTLAIDDACCAGWRKLRPGELVRAGRPQERELSEDPRRRHLLRWTEVLDEFARRRERIRRELEAVEETLRRGMTSLDEDVITRLKEERARLVDERLKLDQERAEVLKQLATSARCVTTTFASFVMNQALCGRPYDRVLVDEASMVPLAAICHALDGQGSGIVLAGDFRQLPPIAQAAARSEEAAAWFGRSVFEWLGVEQRARRSRMKRGGRLAMLREQGRMHPSIAEVVSDVFYDGELETVGEPPSPPPGRPLPAAALVTIDPARVDVPDGEGTTRAPQRVNPSGWTWDRSAMLARALAEALLELDPSWPDRVIVVSPFRAQAQLLERLLQPLDPDRVKAGTIHKMQGDEADVVIFDAVQPRSPFLAASRESPRLVNVAISRARGQVFLLGDPEQLASNPWLEHFVENAVAWEPDWNALDAARGRKR